MNEKAIQTRLMIHVLDGKNHIAAVPNSTQLLIGEADLLSVTRAGLVHEYEIKRTIADYRREFKSYTKKNKHWWLSRSLNYRTYRKPNYFWFVTYEFEIEPPEYSGWILAKTCKTGNWIDLEFKKQAPRLHGGKWGDGEVARIARLLSFRVMAEYEKREDVKPFLDRAKAQ